MDALETFGILILGILVRFMIPIGVTALLVWFFRKLDQQWQEEAKQASVQAMPQCQKTQAVGRSINAQQSNGRNAWLMPILISHAGKYIVVLMGSYRINAWAVMFSKKLQSRS